MDLFSKNPSFQLLLSATEELIREKGCRNTTLKDIIDKTGLSKGAVYHYVSSKDELFGIVLKSKMEESNQQFNDAVQQAIARGDSLRPFRAIAEGLSRNSDTQSVTSAIFIYLLSHRDNPVIQNILVDLHEFSHRMSVQWITIGQQHGAIPASVDADRVTTLLTVFSYGLNVHKLVAPASRVLDTQDILQMLLRSLQHPIQGEES